MVAGKEHTLYIEDISSPGTNPDLQKYRISSKSFPGIVADHKDMGVAIDFVVAAIAAKEAESR